MPRTDRIYCFEALNVDDPLFAAAERLYHATQHPDERIPWGWIARSIKGRAEWRPGNSGKHLLVALPHDRLADAEALAGFAYGTHLPGFGGYICYVGVDERHRQRGVGTRLFDQMFKVLAADAGAADEPMPFVIWESHKPDDAASEADWKLWEARVKLFERVGGYWIEGVELQTPNFNDPESPPVPLELFLKPIDRPLASFDGEALREVVAGLLETVYKAEPGDELYDDTLPPDCLPRLRPASAAGRATRVLATA